LRVHGGNVLEYGGDFLDFSSNLNLFFPKWVLENAWREVSLSRVMLHPSVYPHRLETVLEELLGLEGCVVVLPGSVYGIHLLVQFVKPGRVVIPVPTFNEYERVARVSGVEVFFHELREEQGFKLCLGELASELEEGDLVFVCNPNNPTGGVFGSDEVKGLIRWAKYKEAVVVFDEAFIDFTELCGASELVRENSHVFVLRSFTKFFCVPGLRVGYLLAERGKAEKLRELVPSWSVPVYAEEMLVRLLRFGVNREVIKRQIAGERLFLNRSLSGLGFEVFPSAVNFLFVKTPRNVKASQLKKGLLERKILVRDFPEYEFLGDRFIRVSVRKRFDNKRLVEAVKEVLR